MTALPFPTPDSRSVSEFRKIERENARPAPKPVSQEIGDELREAARMLNILADLSDMQFARCEREQKEEASAFAAFLGEVCRPLDVMLRNIIVTASDNTGAIGDTRDPSLKNIVTDCVMDNWAPYFELAAIGAVSESSYYQARYAVNLSRKLRASLAVERGEAV